MKMKPLVLGNSALSLEEVEQVAVHGRKVRLATSTRTRIATAHRYLLGKARSGGTFYGINTGFGLLSNVRIDDGDIEQLQVNLIRSHAVGVGACLADEQVRAMLLLRAWNLCQGHSGVAVATVQRLLDFLNHGIHPLIPEQGSVGASGDLAPLSHLALPLIGEGRVRFGGKVMDGARALARARLKPLRLGPKEGLALINGTQFMTAIGTLALLKAEHLCDTADVIGAMSVEAMRGTDAAFEPEALAAMYEITGGYPYFIQAYGKAVWDLAPRSPITAADVAVAAPEAERELAVGFFGSRYERATPADGAGGRAANLINNS